MIKNLKDLRAKGELEKIQRLKIRSEAAGNKYVTHQEITLLLDTIIKILKTK